MKVLVLVLTKKAWSWSWSWKISEVLVLVLVLKKKSYLHLCQQEYHIAVQTVYSQLIKPLPSGSGCAAKTSHRKWLCNDWRLSAVFSVLMAPDPTQLSRTNSDNVQNSTTDKKLSDFSPISVFFSRKSVQSAGLALNTLKIRLNSTQLPDELSRIGRCELALKHNGTAYILLITMAVAINRRDM